MNRLDKLKIAGAATSLMLLGTTYIHFRRRQQDKRATKFLQALEVAIMPGTEGLKGIDALDIHYAPRVINRASGKVITMPEALAKEQAAKIYSAWGWFNDDEGAIYSVFREAKDKVQISQIAKAYQVYPNSLMDDLYGRLNRSQLKKLRGIIMPKDAYRTI